MLTPADRLTEFESMIRGMYYQGKTVQQIAAEVGTSEAAVTRALKRSTAKLQYETKGTV